MKNGFYDERITEEWLANWFVNRSKIPSRTQPILRDIDYFEAGWLTSMEIVEFITEIEQEFEIQFSDRDLQDPRFVTIAGIAELILRYAPQPTQSRVI